ncbi:DUF4123 domain-containing protein [Cupriavidus sp. D384]|uniref:DUF4123 domain-containing protein n=1 Tax=Cupriavidus sp. D384 TaxID=1538095 RepID=UPI00083579FA|nr:DUF4123 domain-containing protein [Cupriavidus sp. D384]
MTSTMPLYVLADGAQFPAAVAQLVRQAPEYRNVYAGMPEESAGDASLFLARVGDPHSAWMTKLDDLDQKMPCISLILSDAGIDALAVHLQQFLVADLGDKLSSLVRYFDPRNLAVFLNIFGPEVAGKLTAPLYQWKYRGHSRRWNGINGGAQYAAVLSAPADIKLDQKQLDYLIAHCEPDQMLFSLIERGIVDGSGPYVTRFENFLPRYQRVATWGLTEPMCRLRYCELSYRYGLDFDQHPEVRAALEARVRSGRLLGDHIDALPGYVWEGLETGRGDELNNKEDRSGRPGA